MSALVAEAAVQLLDVVCDELVVRSRISFGLHVNHVLDVLHYAVPQRVLALQQKLLIGNQSEVFLQISLHVHHRTYLKQVERPCFSLRIEIYGELYLHGPPHLALTVLLH